MSKFQLLLPRMGESIEEATIINWLKNEGDEIYIDDLVVEIATDKVDSEVPSDVSGILIEKLCHNKNQYNKVSVFTHNGVLRCLIGNFFQIEKKDWFKIFIPYGTPIQFLYLDGEYYPNIPKHILPKILKNIGLSS